MPETSLAATRNGAKPLGPSPPKLRVITASNDPAMRQAPLYPLPISVDSPTSSSVARLAYGSRTQSPASDRPGLPRRRSDERSVMPKVVRRGSDQNTLSTSRLGGSVYSGREASVYGGRREILSGPTDEDLRLFARHCKQFYFSLDPPEESSRFISTTLATLPIAHRPAYTRVQSSLRSHAHLHHLRLRVTSFHALLASLSSSGSLTPGSRSDLESNLARNERNQRVKAFAVKWHSAGTEPFFRGLWAVLRVQSRGDVSRGGAGGKRVVWEIDDAVFQESGGPDFMQEAVTILKGVLGFTDQALTEPPRLRRIKTLPRSYSDTRNRSVLSFAPSPEPHNASPNRGRADSDPFEDVKSNKRMAPPPPPPRRRSPVLSPSPLTDSRPSEAEDRPLLTSSASHELHQELDEELDDNDIASEEIELNKPRFRLWTFPPHIDDQEAEGLMAVLPKSVGVDRKGKKKDVRFPFVRPGRGAKSLESGEEGTWAGVQIGGEEVAKVPKEDTEKQEGVIREGTGRMWQGIEVRSIGWTGSKWFRFVRWWRRLFGMG